MWKGSNLTLPSVLIVENGSGDVFIVENKKSKSQVEKILKYDTKASATTRSLAIHREPSSPIEIKREIKEEPKVDEYNQYEFLEGSTAASCNVNHLSFVDSNILVDDIQQFKVEPTPQIATTEKREDSLKYTSTHVVSKLPAVSSHEETFNGRWSSDDEEDDFYDQSSDSDSENEPLLKSRKKEKKPHSRKKLLSHKIRNLCGKIACKFCDTIFTSKDSKSAHKCPYLECDAKNFICRVCNKELSKKTFSNHLHETLDCQFCGKKFVNPRNMKIHILKLHKDEKFIPPMHKPQNYEAYVKLKEAEEAARAAVEDPPKPKPKIRYPRKKERFECDLCGKYLTTLRSMSFHMSLHTGDTCYICENCGEKFYTPNGIRSHSCEKKRRRPLRDFRTYDMRYCRFCDSRFASFDENKAHACKYQHPDEAKMVFCRCCGKLLNKLTFNRHMETHSGIDWFCTVCDRKLATERALKVHMTTHSGNKPYKCKLCTETFINKVVLERHMRFHGAAPRTFNCEHCFKQLSTETSLKSHLQRIHKQTVQCELCKAEFPSREDLKDHLMSGHEPSVCTVCNKSFTLPRYLRMHEKLHFEDSMAKVQCSMCSKLLGIKNIKPHVFRHHPEQFDAWQLENPKL